MPEPEAELFRQGVRQRKIIAYERSYDDQDQRPEQDIDAQFLMLRVAAVDDGRKEQPGGQKGGRDPQHRALHMPGTGQRIRKILRHVDAVKALPFNRVVRGKTADEHRSEEHTSELQSLMRNSYAVFCLKKKKKKKRK